MQQVDLFSGSSLHHLANSLPSYWLTSQLSSSSCDQSLQEPFYLNRVNPADFSVNECPSNHIYSSLSESCFKCNQLSSHKKDNFNLSSEFLFLIKLHAKTLSSINVLTQRLDQLEKKLDLLVSLRYSHLNACLPKYDTEISPHRIVTSGTDSGGEFSGTTEANEDELLSLLNQITQHSNQIKQQTVSSRRRESSLLKDFKSTLVSENVQKNSVYTMQAHLSVPPVSLDSRSITTLLYEPDSQRFLENVHQTIKSETSPYTE